MIFSQKTRSLLAGDFGASEIARQVTSLMSKIQILTVWIGIVQAFSWRAFFTKFSKFSLYYFFFLKKTLEILCKFLFKKMTFYFKNPQKKFGAKTVKSET